MTELKEYVEQEPDDIREYIGYLFDERNLKDSSVQTHINVLRSFFCWLNTEGIIRKNPMAKIKSLRVDKKGARHALTTEELERLRDACTKNKEKAGFPKKEGPRQGGVPTKTPQKRRDSCVLLAKSPQNHGIGPAHHPAALFYRGAPLL